MNQTLSKSDKRLQLQIVTHFDFMWLLQCSCKGVCTYINLNIQTYNLDCVLPEKVLQKRIFVHYAENLNCSWLCKLEFDTSMSWNLSFNHDEGKLSRLWSKHSTRSVSIH